MILKTVFIISVIDLSTKNKMLRRGFVILQKSKIQTVGKKKKTFGYFISEIPKFSCMDFFRKCSMFAGALLSGSQLMLHVYFL